MRNSLPIRTRRIWGLVMVMMLLAVLACGTATVTLATVTVNNNSTQPICFVYISPSDSNEWGEDRLGAEDTIEPGESFEISVDPGTYDLRADDCDGNVIDEEQGVEVGTGQNINWDFTDTQ